MQYYLVRIKNPEDINNIERLPESFIPNVIGKVYTMSISTQPQTNSEWKAAIVNFLIKEGSDEKLQGTYRVFSRSSGQGIGKSLRLEESQALLEIEISDLDLFEGEE